VATAERQVVATGVEELETAAPPAQEEAPAAPAEEKKGWFSRRRRPLEERLLERLGEARRGNSRLRAELGLKQVENSARIQEVTDEVESTEQRYPVLQQRLRASQERKRAMDREAADLARAHSPEEGLKWAPLIEEQNTAIRKVVEVVEKMEHDEKRLAADIEECDMETQQLGEDLTAAEGMCASYFAKRRGDA